MTAAKTQNSPQPVRQWWVVPRDAPPDAVWTAHGTAREAMDGLNDCPYEAAVREVWTVPKGEVDAVVREVREAVPHGVFVSPGLRHWSWIADWQGSGLPLTGTIRVDVGALTGVAAPTVDAVLAEVQRQYAAHGSTVLSLPPLP